MEEPSIVLLFQPLFPQELEEYYKQFHIKGSGPGGSFNGPTLKAILDDRHGRLEKLSQIVSKYGSKYTLYIDHLKNLGRLNVAVNMRVLDKPLISEIIKNLGNVFEKLQSEFDLSMSSFVTHQ